MVLGVLGRLVLVRTQPENSDLRFVDNHIVRSMVLSVAGETDTVLLLDLVAVLAPKAHAVRLRCSGVAGLKVQQFAERPLQHGGRIIEDRLREDKV